MIGTSVMKSQPNLITNLQNHRIRRFLKVHKKTSMLESLIIKVAANWLIKKRLRHRYLHGNCARFLRHLLWRTSNVNNDWKLCNNALLCKNKPPALTVVRKDKAEYLSAFVLLYQRICSKENRLLKRIWFTIPFVFTWLVDQSNFKFYVIEP